MLQLLKKGVRRPSPLPCGLRQENPFSKTYARPDQTGLQDLICGAADVQEPRQAAAGAVPAGAIPGAAASTIQCARPAAAAGAGGLWGACAGCNAHRTDHRRSWARSIVMGAVRCASTFLLIFCAIMFLYSVEMEDVWS